MEVKPEKQLPTDSSIDNTPKEEEKGEEPMYTDDGPQEEIPQP